MSVILAKYSADLAPPSLNDLCDDVLDMIIAIMGITGAGKMAFISSAQARMEVSATVYIRIRRALQSTASVVTGTPSD